MSSTDEDKQQAEAMAAQDPYSWEGLRGWRSYRMLRPGRGMFYDVKRRLPYYWSDWLDGLNYRTFAATVRIYFVKYVSTFRRCVLLSLVVSAICDLGTSFTI